jgi:transposase
MKRHELTDAEWGLIADLFPPRPRKRGGQWKDDRLMLNAILWRLRTGAPWRDLPERYGPHTTVHGRLTALRASGLLDRVIGRLQLRLNEAGLIDPELFCIDGTNVRAARAAAGAAKKKSAARGAGRPRPGPQPRRVRHQGPPGHRRHRAALGGRGDRRPAA